MDLHSLAMPAIDYGLLGGLLSLSDPFSLAGSVTEWLSIGLVGQTESEEGISWEQLSWLAGALTVLILPFVVGGFIAKKLKMPTHSMRIGFVLFAVTASVVVLLNRLPGQGVDLRGGTILVYEMAPRKSGESGSEVKSRIWLVH